MPLNVIKIKNSFNIKLATKWFSLNVTTPLYSNRDKWYQHDKSKHAGKVNVTYPLRVDNACSFFELLNGRLLSLKCFFIKSCEV